jgi:Tfp pilus assembly protein PilX
MSYRKSRAQRGVVLFVALIALVVIMLAAIALVRSVDTGNLIAGNVAFRRAATSSADAGVESAISWLIAKEQQDQAKDAFSDADYVLNSTDAANGYYSYNSNNPVDANYLNVTAATTWTDQASKSMGQDASGNTIRYIIQRMCKTPNQVLSETDCLFSDASVDNNSKRNGIPQPQTGGSSVMYRVTARVTGPRNTVSYIQTFVY